MNKLFKLVIVPVVLTGLLVLPPTAFSDEQFQTVAVVSIASLDELTRDVVYLTEAVGAPEMGFLLGAMIEPYAAGFDRTKPGGVFVQTDAVALNVLAFLPVTNLDAALAAIEPRIGAANDAGNGVLEFEGPLPVFVKEQGGWVFIGQTAEALDDLPEDPVELLDDLNNKYDIGLRAYISNIPELYRAWIKAGIQQQLAELPSDDEGGEAALQKKMAQNWLSELDTFFNETESLTIGWKTDADEGNTYLDVGMTAIEGSSLADRVAATNETTSNFTGFLLPEAAVQLHVSSIMNQQDVDQFLPMLASIKSKALEELNEDEDLDDDETREAAKDLLASFFDILLATVKEGKMDGGAALVLDADSFTLATGGRVSSGEQLQEAFQKLVDIAQSEQAVGDVEWNAEEYRDVSLHTMTIPVPEAEAREFLGDRLPVVVGTGEESGYLAVGSDCVQLLKKILDKSAEGADNKVPSGQVTVSLTPILEFVAAVDDIPVVSLMADAVKESNGKDHVYMRTLSADRETISRIEIEEGVLRVIGSAYKASTEGVLGGAALPAGNFVGQ